MSDFQDAYNTGLSQQQPRPTLPTAISDRAIILVDGAGNERVEHLPLEAITGTPADKRGTVTFYSVDSFARYVINQKIANQTRVYVNTAKQAVEAIIDDHGSAPGWGRHRAVLATTTTRVWQEWMAFAKDFHEQVPFAQFIESHISEIANPDGTTLLDMASTLEIKADVEFSSAAKLANGQTRLTYNETLSGTAMKGTAEIPENLTLIMRPIEGLAKDYVVSAKFRYRLNAGKLKLRVEMHRPLDVLDEAFADRIADLAAAVGADLIFQGDAPAEQKPELRK